MNSFSYKTYLAGLAIRLGLRHRRDFADVAVYGMFVGHPRSGHTIVKALLDAHRNAVIAQEANALKFVGYGINRWLLYSLILARARWFAEAGSVWDEYSYEVPGQWQGRFEKLVVIGDKKAGKSAELILRRPELLARLRKTVGDPVRIIHIVRNPFDNISTIFRKHNTTLEDAADQYFRNCQGIHVVRARYPEIPMRTMRLEEFLASPQDSLRSLCGFLGLEDYPGYLEDCAAIVFASPNLSRNRVTWNPSLIESILERSRAFDFLEGYSFK